MDNLSIIVIKYLCLKDDIYLLKFLLLLWIAINANHSTTTKKNNKSTVFYTMFRAYQKHSGSSENKIFPLDELGRTIKTHTQSMPCGRSTGNRKVHLFVYKIFHIKTDPFLRNDQLMALYELELFERTKRNDKTATAVFHIA